MVLHKFISTKIFLITFIISLILVYFVNPEPVIVYRFPNPDNAGKLTYQDKSKNCYKYEKHEVKCPTDPSLILEHPIIIH